MITNHERDFGPNPFPSDHPLHSFWEGVVRRAAEENAALIAKTTIDVDVPSILGYFVEWFDIHSKAVLDLHVWSYATAQTYEEKLEKIAREVLDWAQRSTPAHYFGQLRAQLRARLTQRSAHWVQMALKRVRELGRIDDSSSAQEQSNGDVDRVNVVDVDPPPQVSWAEVEIVFISDFTIQVSVNGRMLEPRKYGELGFEDGRAKVPNAAWRAFRELAENDGTFSTRPSWSKIEKRVQEIRRGLRDYFVRENVNIPRKSEPIPFVPGRGGGYQTQFKLSLRRYDS